MTSHYPVDNTSLMSAESWDKAREVVALIQPVPGFIRDIVGTLWRENQGDSFHFHSGHQFTLRLLKKNSLLLSILEQAAKDVCPDRLREKTADNQAMALLSCLGKNVFSAVLSLSYLERRFSKLLGQGQQWKKLSVSMRRQTEFAHVVGSIFEHPGPGTSMLFGGIRAPARALMYLSNPLAYQMQFESSETLIMQRTEIADWGCNESQIVALLINELGYSMDLHLLNEALSETTDYSLPPFYKNVHAMLQWVNHFEYSELPPLKQSPFEPLIPTMHQYNFMKQYAYQLKTNQPRFKWLSFSRKQN